MTWKIIDGISHDICLTPWPNHIGMTIKKPGGFRGGFNRPNYRILKYRMANEPKISEGTKYRMANERKINVF